MSEDKFYIKDLQPIREFCLNSEKEDIYKYIYSLQQENKQLKEVIEEVREEVENSSLEVNTREYGTLTVCDSDNLLQILDKVGDENEQ